jgi:hypothetical protein
VIGSLRLLDACAAMRERNAREGLAKHYPLRNTRSDAPFATITDEIAVYRS